MAVLGSAAPQPAARRNACLRLPARVLSAVYQARFRWTRLRWPLPLGLPRTPPWDGFRRARAASPGRHPTGLKAVLRGKRDRALARRFPLLDDCPRVRRRPSLAATIFLSQTFRFAHSYLRPCATKGRSSNARRGSPRGYDPLARRVETVQKGGGHVESVPREVFSANHAWLLTDCSRLQRAAESSKRRQRAELRPHAFIPRI